jgi:hypothetical protein
MLGQGRGIVPKHATALQRHAPARKTEPVQDIVRLQLHGPQDAPATTTITDGGGSQLAIPQVYLLFWGSRWGASPPPAHSMSDLCNAFAKIIAGPYLSAAAQYGNHGSAKLIAAYWIDHSDPPNNFLNSDVQREIADLIDLRGLSYDPHGYYLVIMPPGIEAKDKSLAGEHFHVRHEQHVDNLTIGWVLYSDDVNETTAVFAHELVEGMTDPCGTGIQVNPTDRDSWHEIGDVCQSVASSNGVVVNSYWSQEDKVCVVPTWVRIKNRKITCIRKSSTVDPHHAIKLVGGISVESGEHFHVTEEQCIQDIDNGVRYFVVGADGSEADVEVRAWFPTWARGRASRFIAASPDRSPRDNLLSLPECPHGPGIPG